MYRLMIDWLEAVAGSRGARRILPKKMGRIVAQFMRDKENNRSVSRALAGRKANLDTIAAFLTTQPTLLRAPLVLVSQVQRSGGSLLSQLFDGHPVVAAHPHELMIGHPSDEDWPPLDPALGSEKNFRMLFDIGTLGLLRRGYTKGNRDPDRHSFYLVPHVQFHVFQHLFQTTRPCGPRDILDLFFTAYFNGWLNYQGKLEEKRWIAAFAPRLADHTVSVAGFFDSYPDGRLIQVIRDPATWYPSARRHLKSGLGKQMPDEILSKWCLSANAMLRNKADYSDNVIIVRFEDLVGDTARTMRAIARDLDIAFDPILLTPTFNGRPIRANSSFAVETSGVLMDTLKRQNTLTGEERALVEQRCRAIYEKVSAISLPPAEVPLRASVGA